MTQLRHWFLMFAAIALLASSTLLAGCETAGQSPTPTAVAKTSQEAAPAASKPATAAAVSQPTTAPSAQKTVSQPSDAQHKAKYLFVFIGDGMAVAQRNAAELYMASTKSPNARPEETKLVMNSFPAQGMNTTYDLTSVIPDSASTATAISTGFKTASGVVGMDPTGTKKYETIAEIAKKKGLKVGVISSVSLDHATPAAFYAHQKSRSNMYEINLELGKSGFDYFGGGAMAQPKGKNGDQPDAVEAAKANGYKVVTTKAEFDKLAPGAGKVLAMNGVVDKDAALYYELDRAKEDISLAEYVKKGIELLDNPNGFVMAVEGGKIDWACHANDAAASIHDTLAFDAAVSEAVKFYEKHPKETLIVVTGDHETGGMTIGFAGTQYSAFFDKIKNQKMSYIEFGKKLDAFKKEHNPETAKFEDIVPLIRDAFGLLVLSNEERAELEKRAKEKDKEAQERLGMALSGLEIKVVKEAFQESMKDIKIRAKDDHTYLLYGGYEPLAVKLTTILNQKAGIGWTSYSHTGVPVQTSAIGVGHELFNGYYDQTDIHKKMMKLTGLN